MYLLVTIKDASKVSDAIAALVQTGFTQFTTGDKMADICTDCQNRSMKYSFDAHSPLPDENEDGQLCNEPVFKTEEPDEPVGVSAEDLMGNQEDTKPDCLDMLPSTSGTLDEDTFPSTTGHHILKRRFVSQEEENVDSSDLTFHGKLKHKVGMLNGHLMRLHRVNQDGTAYYYCYYRNRATSQCPGTYRFNQSINRITELVKHNHSPNSELDRTELIKYQQKEIARNGSNMKPKEIIKQTCREFNVDYKKTTKLGAYDAQRKRIQRAKASQRKKAHLRGTK